MFLDGSLNDRNITSKDFKWIFNPYYGNCYQLNLDSSLKTESILNQIELKFNLNQTNVFNLKNNMIYVMVNSQLRSNSFTSFDNVIKAQVGYTTEIKLEKLVFEKSSKPYSDCEFIPDKNNYGQFLQNIPNYDSKYYNQIINYENLAYSQSLCFNFCQIDKHKTNCKLRVNSISIINNMDNFCPDKNISIFDPQRPVKILYKQFYEDTKYCEKYCPLECKTEIYRTYSSSYQIIDDESDSSANLNLNINFNSLSYFDHFETPLSRIRNLLSNIGGALGLFLGIKILIFN
jgi:hypothetical protein